MSRPPRPVFRTSTTQGGGAFESRGRFLPIEFGDLVALQRELAESDAGLGVTGEPGDFARTLFELSALVTHTLGLHQDLYAGEAFLTRAKTTRSLVLHARRLAYEPDQGLAASGWVMLTIGPGLRGTLPAGFAVASSPRGEIKAQTFETLDALEVDAGRNEALPIDRERPAKIDLAGGSGSFWLGGRSLSLEVNAFGVLMRERDATWTVVTIDALHEDESRDATEVMISVVSGDWPFSDPEYLGDPTNVPEFLFLAMPKEQLRRFGWDADSVRFPPSAVNTEATYATPTTPGVVVHGYEVSLDSGELPSAEDIYLSVAFGTNVADGIVVAKIDGLWQPLKVIEQGSATVALRRGEIASFPTGVVDDDNIMITQDVTVESHITGTVTYLRLETSTAIGMNRSAVSVVSPIYADWQFEATVLATEPNPAPIESLLVVDADYGEFRPGGVVVFQTLDGSASQAREVQKLTVLPSGDTELYTTDLTTAPAGGWTLDNVKVFGNVARVTHGERHEEILGGSDGVTMFLRFELKKAPLTLVPGANGGEPAIEVFVNDVAWSRVDDFFDSTPHDRHYRLEFDEAHTASVVFGNGIKGAIPPSGKKHIRAVYRHALGVLGNVDRRAVSRIKRAHPLVTGATNPVPFIGGADAADLADLERQATRFIRTFDRAVSVQDHADLALLFPGVARAAARPWSAGLEVVVATADGGEPALAEVRNFLDARRDDTLALDLVGPDPVDLWLDVVIEYDPALLKENVKRAVQDALVGEDARGPGLFTFAAREFGQAAHLSEVYERVGGTNGVEGVTSVDVTRFRIGDAVGVFDVLQVSARQWLRLKAANLTIKIQPGAAE